MSAFYAAAGVSGTKTYIRVLGLLSRAKGTRHVPGHSTSSERVKSNFRCGRDGLFTDLI